MALLRERWINAGMSNEQHVITVRELREMLAPFDEHQRVVLRIKDEDGDNYIDRVEHINDGFHIKSSVVIRAYES